MSKYFDIDKFINEIHQRLGIWIFKLHERFNKKLRNKAWKRILCCIFFEKFDDY